MGCRVRLRALMDEAMRRGELVQSPETGLWYMGPYAARTARDAFFAAGGGKRKTEEERQAEHARDAAMLEQLKEAVALAERASAAGVRLTKAELNGLMRRRPEVMTRVDRKVAEAKARLTTARSSSSARTS